MTMVAYFKDTWLSVMFHLSDPSQLSLWYYMTSFDLSWQTWSWKKKKTSPNTSCCLLPIAIYFSEPEFTSVVCCLSGFPWEKKGRAYVVASHGEMTSAWRINRGQESVQPARRNWAVIVIKWDSPVSDQHHQCTKNHHIKKWFLGMLLRRVLKGSCFLKNASDSIKATVWKKATLRDRNRISGCQIWGWEERIAYRRQEGTLGWSWKRFYILVASGDYMVVYICQNSENCTPQKGGIYSIKIILISFTLKMYRFKLLDNLHFLL